MPKKKPVEDRLLEYRSKHAVDGDLSLLIAEAETELIRLRREVRLVTFSESSRVAVQRRGD